MLVVTSILIRANNDCTELYKVHFVSDHFGFCCLIFNFKITWVTAIFLNGSDSNP